MKLGTTDKGEILLTEVYSGVLFETDDKETIGICMRDTGFEFNYNGVWYEAKQGIVREMKKEEPKQETLEKATTYQQELFNYLHDLGVIALQSEMQEIERIVLSMQQERMYSEEEVMDMFHNLSMHLPLHYEFLVKEQFKNK